MHRCPDVPMACAWLFYPISQRMCHHPTSRSDASPMSVSIASRSAFTSLDDRSWYPEAPDDNELVQIRRCTSASHFLRFHIALFWPTHHKARHV